MGTAEMSVSRQRFLEVVTRSVQELGGVVLFVHFPWVGLKFECLWGGAGRDPEHESPSPFVLVRKATKEETDRQLAIYMEVTKKPDPRPILTGEPWFAVTD